MRQTELKNNIQRDHVDYYQKLKELYLLHKKLGFGRHPDIPHGFSEVSGE